MASRKGVLLDFWTFSIVSQSTRGRQKRKRKQFSKNKLPLYAPSLIVFYLKCHSYHNCLLSPHNKFISEHQAIISELPNKFGFDKLTQDYKNINASTQFLVDDVKFIEATIKNFEEQKEGKQYNIEELKETIRLIRLDMKSVTPTLLQMKRKSRDVLKASLAAEKYMEETKGLLEYHQVEYIWPRYEELKKLMNLEVRNKYDKEWSSLSQLLNSLLWFEWKLMNH